MINFIAEICTKLRYVNKSKEPVTVTQHCFPIDQGAAVVEFTAKIDGEFVGTEVKDVVIARQEMQQAETSAVLLEQLYPDTLAISINNLRPNSQATVSITYVIELLVNELWLPESPRKEKRKPRFFKCCSGPPQDDDVNGTVTRFMIPAKIFPAVPLKIEIISVMENRIKSISSPTHDFRSKKLECPANGNFVMKTTLSGKEIEHTDSDIVLHLECDNPKTPMMFVEKSHDSTDEDAMVAVSFAPSFQPERLPKETIFLIDKSSKPDTETNRFYWHSGSKIAKPLIFSHQLIDENEEEPSLILSKNCFFNVVRYGKFSTTVFPNGSEPYNKETMEKAISIIHVGCYAMGANNLDAALERVLQQCPKNGLPRQVILFIRGKVTNESSILDLVRQHAHNTTVFCVGQGAIVSKAFVRDIARAGGGTSHFIANSEERLLVLHYLSKDAYFPELKELRISWQDSTGKALNGWDNFDDTEPFASISPSYKGERLLVYGKFPASQVPVTITAESHENSSSKDVVQISREKASQLSAKTLQRLVAQKLTKDLEKQGFGSKDVNGRIIKFALKHQVLSKFTSFVGKANCN